jgi:RNA polymerase sigma-70 factor (ECF subfamily)
MQEQSPFGIYKDEELMLLICNGEARAFDELYNRYAKRLMVYFKRMLNFNRHTAKDALQDLFLKIAEAPEKFDRTRSFQTWIFTLASNTCKNYYRHQEVVNRHAETIVAEEKKHEQFIIEAISKLDAALFNQMLEEVLNELPAEKKEAFILKYQEEKSIIEIAEIQNCAEGTVKSRIFYTVKILEEKLKIFKPIY